MIHSRKIYYSIREVCEITDLEQHVLRYWESEFSELKPKKNRAGNRAYREKDIEIIKQIKHLLYAEQFTIPGARKKLSEMKSTLVLEEPPVETPQSIPVESAQDETPQQAENDYSYDVKTTGSATIISSAVLELKEVLQILTSR